MKSSHEIAIEIAADVTRLIKEVERAEAAVGKGMKSITMSADFATKALAAMGVGLSAAAVVGFVRDQIDAADAMSKLSQRIGVQVEEIGGLQLAFRQSGLDSGKLAEAMGKLSLAAENGHKAFQALGVSALDSDGRLKTSRQLLADLSDRFASIEDGSGKTALAMQLFGETGGALIPLLNGSADGLERFDNLARSLGLTIDTETAQAAERFNDTLDLMGQGVSGIGLQVAAQLLPTLEALAGGLLESFTEGERLSDLTEVLAVGMKAVAAGVLVVVDVLRAAARGFRGLFEAIEAVLEGRFKDAGTALADAFSDNVDLASGTIENIRKLFDESSREAVSALSKLGNGAKETAPSIRALSNTTRVAAEQAKEYAKYLREVEKAKEDARKVQEALTLAEQKAADVIREQVVQTRRQAEQLVMTAQQTFLAEQANIDFALSVVEMRRAMASMSGDNLALIAEYDAQIQALHDLKQARLELFNAEANQALARASQQVGSALEDELLEAFRNAFSQSGEFARSLKRSLEQQFSTMVLRPVIRAVLEGDTGLRSGQLSGALGSASAFSVGGVSGAVLNQMFKAAGDFSNSAYAFTQSGQQFAGVAATLGKLAPYAGSIAAVLQGDVKAGIGSAVGTAVGSLAGPIGAAVGGALGGLLGGRNKVSAELIGNARFAFADGQQVGFSGTNAGAVQGGALEIARQYQALVELLGGDVIGFTAAFAANTGRQGQSPMFGLDVEAGGKRLFTQGETAFTDQAVGEATARAVAALLQSSNFAENVREVVQAIDVTNASFSQLTASLENARVVSAVNTMFIDFTGNLGELHKAGSAAILDFVQLSGGLENLNQSVGFFVQNFYREAEQLDLLNRQVSRAFEALNLAMPRTRDEFRLLVESQDLNTAAGRQTRAALVGLSQAMDQLLPQFDELTVNVQALAQQALDNASSDLAAAFDRERAGLQEIVDAAAAAEQALRSAYQRESAELLQTAQRFRQFSQSVKEFRESLVGGLSGRQMGEVLEDRFLRTVELARMGDENAFGRLQADTTEYLRYQEKYSTDFVDYVKKFAVASSALQSVEIAAELTADNATMQLEQLTLQVATLIEMKALDQSTLAAIVEFKAAQAAANVAQSQMLELDQQRNALLGDVNTNLISLAQAIQQFNLAKSAVGGGGSGVLGAAANSLGAVVDETDSNQAFVARLYQQIGGRDVDPAGLKFYSEQLANGNKTPAQVTADLLYAKQQLGQRFSGGGLVLGPGSGTSDEIMAWLSNREFVMNAAATSALGPGNLDYMNRTGQLPGMDALAQEIARLSSELQAFKQDNSRENIAILSVMDRTNNTLTRVTQKSDSVRVSVISP